MLKDKDRTSIINALKAGVVPPVGLRHMQVGRKDEIEEMVKDLSHVLQDGSTVRFIIGDFGAGKSFFLNLAKLMAHEKKMVVINADITTEKILCSTDGKARALLTELLKNMSTRSRPDGNALKSVIETWIAKVAGTSADVTENMFYRALEPVSHLALSNDFGRVLFRYFNAYKENDSVVIEKCIKWLRAEYDTKTEAKNDLGVSKIIEDTDFYDVIKFYSSFVKVAGFAGLVIAVDELAVLIRQQDRVRKKNYETILTIVNDCLQGSVKNTSFIFGATTEAIENKERGLFTYGALETRLSENRFANPNIKDITGPVIRLQPLSKEELYVLLNKLRDIYANFDQSKWLIPEDGIKHFFEHTFSRMGASAHLTPRDVIRDYVSLLSVLESNPELKWQDVFTQMKNSQPTEAASGLTKLR